MDWILWRIPILCEKAMCDVSFPQAAIPFEFPIIDEYHTDQFNQSVYHRRETSTLLF